jgi:hypothetical protein
MYRDIVYTTKYIHDLRLHDVGEGNQMASDRREARATNRLRSAVGHGLIILGRRLAEHPSTRTVALDKVA